MTYKPFNPVTQKMYESLKLAWLHKMAHHPNQFTRGRFIDKKTGCKCALGQLLDVLGRDPSSMKHPHPAYPIETIGRFSLCEYYLGPIYERVYGLSDGSSSYEPVMSFINTKL